MVKDRILGHLCFRFTLFYFTINVVMYLKVISCLSQRVVRLFARLFTLDSNLNAVVISASEMGERIGVSIKQGTGRKNLKNSRTGRSGSLSGSVGKRKRKAFEDKNITT